MRQDKVEVFRDGKWVEVDACPICGSSEHSAHCGRCNRPLVRHPDGKTESCPMCTTRIGRW